MDVSRIKRCKAQATRKTIVSPILLAWGIPFDSEGFPVKCHTDSQDSQAVKTKTL